MFAEKLKELRKKKDLTQNEMATILNTVQTTYSGWEKNKEPKYIKLKEIANYFKVSIDYLLDNEKEKKETILTKIERELTEKEKRKLEIIIKTMYPNEYKKITNDNI